MNRSDGNPESTFTLVSTSDLSEVNVIIDLTCGQQFNYIYRKDGNIIHVCPPGPLSESYESIPLTSTKNDDTLDVVLFCEEFPSQGALSRLRGWFLNRVS